MMLRSSSTPILGSLLPSSSFSDSPNNHSELNGPTQKPPTTNTTTHGRIISCGPHHSCRKKPLLRSPSPAGPEPGGGFRRIQSEGNLDELLADDAADELFALPKKPAAGKTSCRRTLEAIPSFSSHQSTPSSENGEEFESGGFFFSGSKKIESLVSENVRDSNVGLSFGDIGKMYLAAGLGVSGIGYINFGGNGGGGGGGGGGSHRSVDFDKEGGDVSVEEHYRRMMEENPGNALFMSNYAQFLYQKKKDFKGAEEYYSRAILADPKDGEILSQYAKLIWELHRDRERANNYFERAVQASSQDSHVHAAFASFLWDTEDDDEEDEEDNFLAGKQLVRHGFMAPATA
ncbi:Tetratricopeptide repeat (TPR)-like superfamily protein [Striga hermonthica]|uniref:Tetratricopeptide repeat (TPR)-like superfamily protein n=1 Tax=Striga hermonthica TaxID=68872 RepID=A0A9N7RB89_STRHE|nr:Tetratricopeptide repeat (TPR)-like superfamily protein [Striga hermonthica]